MRWHCCVLLIETFFILLFLLAGRIQMALHSGERETPFTTVAAATAGVPAPPLHAVHLHSEDEENSLHQQTKNAEICNWFLSV